MREKIRMITGSRSAQNGYLCFVAVMAALKALGFYEGQTVFTLFMVIACLLVLAAIVRTPHTLPEWAVIAALLGMGGLVYLNTGEKSLLIIVLVLAGSKGVSARRSVKVFLAVWGCCYILLTFLSLTGVCGDVLLLHDKHGIGDIICHSLGYSHPNVLHMNYLCISAAVLYLAKDRFTKRQRLALLAVLTALDAYVFLYTWSYTGLLGTGALYLLYLYAVLREKSATASGAGTPGASGGTHLCRAEQLLAQLVLPACLLFSLAGPLVIKGRLFDIINSALNTRYYLTKWFFMTQPVTLFGTRFVTYSYHFTLDCSYAYLFLQLGVIPFAVLMLLYMGTIRQLVKEDRLSELALVLGLCIGGIAEPFLFNLGFKNVTLFLVGEYLFRLPWLHRGRTYMLLPQQIIDFPGNSLLRNSHQRVPACADASTVTRNATQNVTPDDISGAPCSGQPAADSVIPAESMPERISGGICRAGGDILAVWMHAWRRYLLIFAVIFSLAGGAAFCARQTAGTVYVSESLSYIDDGPEPVYLTAEQVEQVRAGGDFVFDYADGEPLYAYSGRVALIESTRIRISWGVWCALAVCVGLAWAEIRSGHLRAGTGSGAGSAGREL